MSGFRLARFNDVHSGRERKTEEEYRGTRTTGAAPAVGRLDGLGHTFKRALSVSFVVLASSCTSYQQVRRTTPVPITTKSASGIPLETIKRCAIAEHIPCIEQLGEAGDPDVAATLATVAFDASTTESATKARQANAALIARLAPTLNVTVDQRVAAFDERRAVFSATKTTEDALAYWNAWLAAFPGRRLPETMRLRDEISKTFAPILRARERLAASEAAAEANRIKEEQAKNEAAARAAAEREKRKKEAPTKLSQALELLRRGRLEDAVALATDAREFINVSEFDTKAAAFEWRQLGGNLTGTALEEFIDRWGDSAPALARQRATNEAQAARARQEFEERIAQTKARSACDTDELASRFRKNIGPSFRVTRSGGTITAIGPADALASEIAVGSNLNNGSNEYLVVRFARAVFETCQTINAIKFTLTANVTNKFGEVVGTVPETTATPTRDAYQRMMKSGLLGEDGLPSQKWFEDNSGSATLKAFRAYNGHRH